MLMLFDEEATKDALISGLILLFFLIAAHGRSTPQTFEPHSALQGGMDIDQEFPVIYGKKDDGFPDRVNLRGRS